MKQKKVQAGLRLPNTLNEETAKVAAEIGISKNDFILIAIQEKLKKDKRSQLK